MADAANINTIQAPATSTNPMLEEFYYVHNYSNQVPTIHFRHSGRANVLFCDGHVETLAMVEGTEDIRLLSARVGRLASVGDRARFTP
jgi:prepilin-type processing-associated H-X9-DG protein